MGVEFYIDEAHYISGSNFTRKGGLLKIKDVFECEDSYLIWVEELPNTVFGFMKDGKAAWGGILFQLEQKALKIKHGQSHSRYIYI